MRAGTVFHVAEARDMTTQPRDLLCGFLVLARLPRQQQVTMRALCHVGSGTSKLTTITIVAKCGALSLRFSLSVLN